MERASVCKSFLAAMLLSLLMILALQPGEAFAHASLLKAEPASNSRLSQSPAQVTLEFNERLETHLAYVKVLNQAGESVTDEPAQPTEDHKGLILSLPQLEEGYYSVNYHIVSADGHPVDGSYVFTVGVSYNNGNPNAAFGDPALGQVDVLSKQMTLPEVLKLLSRSVYFFALLALCGWALLRLILNIYSQSARRSFRAWGIGLQRLFILSLFALIYFQYDSLLGGNRFEDWRILLLESRIGQSWLMLAVLSIIGFALLFRYVWFDVLWVIAMLAVESQNGHAAAGAQPIQTIALDFVHLAAASIWVGGLLWLLAFWRRHREEVERGIRRFSTAAFWSLFLLAATGAALTLLFLPNLKYLFYSQWGTLLLIKTTAVLAVVIVAVCIRIALRRRNVRSQLKLVRLDFLLMAIIVLIVGVLTYAMPIPANEPLHWHEMGETIHMTAKITPKAVGDNEFEVQVWLPQDDGAPQQVQLELQYKDDNQVAPVDVPLVLQQDEASEFEDFIGFKKYTYASKGPFLQRSGDWEIHIQVIEQSGETVPYVEPFRVY